jgi:hypothetical protein
MWKKVPLPGYQRYEINEAGQVRNAETGRILHPTLNGNKSVCVNLRDAQNHNKLFSLRNLVYETYIGPMGRILIENINGNPFDNAPRNLRAKIANTSQARGIIASRDMHTIKGIWDVMMQELMPESYSTIWKKS